MVKTGEMEKVGRHSRSIRNMRIKKKRVKEEYGRKRREHPRIKKYLISEQIHARQTG